MKLLQAIHTALQTLHDQQGQYWRKLPELAAAVTTLVATKVTEPLDTFTSI
jgi:hypothetical protein